MIDQLNDAVADEQKISRYLYCDLTLEEQRERGLLLANITNDIDSLKDEVKRVTGEYKTKILEAEQRAGQVKTMVLTRREQRDVVCTQFFNVKRSEVYVVRDDLNVIVETRSMTDRERQLHLPIIEETASGNGHEETKGEAAKRGRGRSATAGV
jgi:hypothetical protein